MRISLARTVAPSSLAVDPAMATQYPRASSQDRALVSMLTEAAVERVEKYLRRSLITQQWELAIDDGPSDDWIELPYPPLVSVQSIKTYDLADNESTFDAASYIVDVAKARVFLKYGQIWPSPLRAYRSMVVAYTTGYGATPDDVPGAIRLGILRLVTHYYDKREITDVLPRDVKQLLAPYYWSRLGP